jgi:hypothetical protein
MGLDGTLSGFPAGAGKLLKLVFQNSFIVLRPKPIETSLNILIQPIMEGAKQPQCGNLNEWASYTQVIQLIVFAIIASIAHVRPLNSYRYHIPNYSR